ncbi:hypothetical protein BJN42_26665 [Pseudomonas koreensis]|uniref:DUF4376 domain-containing protein n=1 Tax=Pseudomonas sp. GXM4 TaxID=2651867 RepID=UPI0008ADDB05|nr:hypothetical protein [Pseudomonas sp. GXM4]KAB2524850.1 DUF4376 domain-containing protein [Pseudomonas sp. GXM4]OFJ42672.1 hypothetical protein BJN42_26665 [Pseudomonas koreensis]
MTAKIVYQTDHLGLYVGETEADESPLEPGVFLIPGGCVEVPPPQAPEFKRAYWTGSAWQLLDYFEGLIVYNIRTRAPLTLTGPGSVPNGYTMKTPGLNQIWKDGQWVDDLDTLLAKFYPQKLDALDAGCALYIESGFESDALGEHHRYDSTLEDRVNLTGLILSEREALYPCHNTTSPPLEKVFREHTAPQLHLLGQHLVVFQQRALQQSQELKKLLDNALNAKDLSALQAIEWSPPA